jgi:hypothetical protein
MFLFLFDVKRIRVIDGSFSLFFPFAHVFFSGELLRCFVF